jgi:DNA-binding NtrC family response regulator
VSDNGDAPLTILVVEPAADHRGFLESVLRSPRVDVITAEMFHEGRSLVERRSPDLLITELRLGEYNGLHLVMRAQAQHPAMGAIIMSDWLDPVLQGEAERLHATFVPKPVTIDELLAAVARTCFRDPASSEAIRAPFERRVFSRRTAALPVDAQSDRRRVDDRRRHDALSLAGAVVTS